MMDQLSLVPYEGGSDGGKYKECMRNHAAAMGGQAFDGCGEFMPSSPDALQCAACGCHRSFHRRAATGGSNAPLFFRPPPPALSTAPPPPHQHHHVAALQAFLPPPTPAPAPPHLALPYHAVPAAPWSSVRPGSETPPRPEDHLMGFGFGGGSGSSGGRKRFRTKFTPEQKERMREFAEKQGWRINRNDDGALERFCHEIGVRRQVLKVWMHNHKNNHNTQQKNHDQHHHHHLAAASVPTPPSAADVGAAMTGISINPAAGTGTGTVGVGMGVGVGVGGDGDDDDDDDDDDDTDDSPPRAAVSSPSPSPISV